MRETTEDRSGHHSRIRRKVMAIRKRRSGYVIVRVRHSQAKTHVRSGTVVVPDPFKDERAEMLLAEWDDPVQALAPQRADEAFAKGVGLRRADGSARDSMPND
jgi:hypothetical protein